MPTLVDVARDWQASGVSLIPILGNQTKRPAVRWAPYQAQLPTLGEIDEWWANGHSYGLALICGPVSGNMEMLELEAEACINGGLLKVWNAVDEAGCGEVWDLLSGDSGYSESSPTGGLHLLYRISDHDVPGNTKIASRPHGSGPKTLAETRGDGGYVIVAPTSGVCHPSGHAWSLIKGQYGQLPTITWEQRNLLHAAIHKALDEMPPPPVNLPAVIPFNPTINTGTSPGDDFEAHTDWAEILEPHGWQLESRHGTERHWTRPGKDRRDGSSGTTGRAQDRDRLYVFSTSTVFQSEVPYTKFGAWALLNHHGDHSAAARALAKQGFGDHHTVILSESIDLEQSPNERKVYRNDEVGNSERMLDAVGQDFKYVAEENEFYTWTGTVWERDITGAIRRAWRGICADAEIQAKASNDEVTLKWIRRCFFHGRENSALAMFKAEPGVTISSTGLNPNRDLINLHNGVFNVRTRTLVPHDRQYLMTHMFGANYDPTATCPKFEDFMAKAIPDPDMRGYVQRALGYTLLGDPDERAIFLIHGPSGTGKSTLMETIQRVFGTYGSTAASGTFKATRGGDKGPSNDLHRLRGKRFVSTSETSESAIFDEDLIKRVTGKDTVTSRALYQEHVEWVPEFCLWLATNNPPRFSTDDDAIWRRAKLVPFTTVFRGEEEIKGYSEKVLSHEADGILNWLLAGLADFLADGLQEPEQIQEYVTEQRVQSDPVAQFILERINDGRLTKRGGTTMRQGELYAMYQDWCRGVGERIIRSQRLIHRMAVSFPDLKLTGTPGNQYWQGIGRVPGTGVLGMIMAPDQMQPEI